MQQINWTTISEPGAAITMRTAPITEPLPWLTELVRTLRSALDAEPGNVRLACELADELASAGAPEGYVALARLDRVPWRNAINEWYWCPETYRAGARTSRQVGRVDRSELPLDWLRLFLRTDQRPPLVKDYTDRYDTRAIAEAAAVDAFERLALARRAALLRGDT